METRLEEAKKVLIENGQEHVLVFLEKLSGEEREALIKQVLSIDFSEIGELYELTKKDAGAEVKDLEPVSVLNPARLRRRRVWRIHKCWRKCSFRW